MKRFIVEIDEITVKTTSIEIMAESFDAVHDEVHRLYDNGEIIFNGPGTTECEVYSCEDVI